MIPTYRATKIKEPLVIDGRLDKTVWQKAEAVPLVIVDTGATPKATTTARLLWDDKFLYAGFECVDTDIWATLTKHDEPLYNEDAVEFFICPRPPKTKAGVWNYFELEWSARNVSFDAFILHPRTASDQKRSAALRGMLDWTCDGLQNAVTLDGKLNNSHPKKSAAPRKPGRGWTLEAAIPFSELVTAPHIPPKKGDVWRVNFLRIDHTKDASEFQAWSPTGRLDYHVPERFGKLVFA